MYEINHLLKAEGNFKDGLLDFWSSAIGFAV